MEKDPHDEKYGKIPLGPANPGFGLATFRPRIQYSTDRATGAPMYDTVTDLSTAMNLYSMAMILGPKVDGSAVILIKPQSA